LSIARPPFRPRQWFFFPSKALVIFPPDTPAKGPSRFLRGFGPRSSNCFLLFSFLFTFSIDEPFFRLFDIWIPPPADRFRAGYSFFSFPPNSRFFLPKETVTPPPLSNMSTSLPTPPLTLDLRFGFSLVGFPFLLFFFFFENGSVMPTCFLFCACLLVQRVF